MGWTTAIVTALLTVHPSHEYDKKAVYIVDIHVLRSEVASGSKSSGSRCLKWNFQVEGGSAAVPTASGRT